MPEQVRCVWGWVCCDGLARGVYEGCGDTVKACTEDGCGISVIGPSGAWEAEGASDSEG